MLVGIDRMMAGLDRQMVQLDQLANNVANVDTPGFRASGSGLRRGTFAEWLRRSDGDVAATDNGLDVALDPGTWLQVRTPQGDRFTRRGDLRLDDQQRLVTGDGNPVVSDAGAEIVVPGGRPTLEEDGAVKSNGVTVARLGRYRVERFLETGGTLFTPAPDGAVEESRSPLRIGALERANVNPALEQTRLVETLARARAYQRFALVQDQTLGRLITDVGRTQAG